MLQLSIPSSHDSPLKILCIGAHPDDIELGCGATMLGLLDQHREVSVKWVVLSGTGERSMEAKNSSEIFLEDAAQKLFDIQSFRDGYFPSDRAKIKDYFESELKSFGPDLIFTHRSDDLHQDHRIISELTWNTFRIHLRPCPNYGVHLAGRYFLNIPTNNLYSGQYRRNLTY